MNITFLKNTLPGSLPLLMREEEKKKRKREKHTDTIPQSHNDRTHYLH